MAITQRKGEYKDFDPDKMLPAELAVVRSGDPNAKDGRAVYVAFEAGTVKRMATYEDMKENIETASEEIIQEVSENLTVELNEAVQNANTATENANTAITNANMATSEAATAAGAANDATDAAIQAAEAANNAAAGDISNKTLTYTIPDEEAEPESGLTLKDWAGRIVKKLSNATGDSAENTVTFESDDTVDPTTWEEVGLLTSGENHASLFRTISQMFKNIRWMYKMLGISDISTIGNGTITGALSTLNSKKLYFVEVEYGDITIGAKGWTALSTAQLNGKKYQFATISNFGDATGGFSVVYEPDSGLWLGGTPNAKITRVAVRFFKFE